MFRSLGRVGIGIEAEGVYSERGGDFGEELSGGAIGIVDYDSEIGIMNQFAINSLQKFIAVIVE